MLRRLCIKLTGVDGAESPLDVSFVRLLGVVAGLECWDGTAREIAATRACLRDDRGATSRCGVGAGLLCGGEGMSWASLSVDTSPAARLGP